MKHWTPSHRRSVVGVIVLLGLFTLGSSTAGSGLLDLGKGLLEGTSSPAGTSSSLPSGEIASGLKEALEVGTERVVSQLGRTDGFNADPAVHIPLPGSLQTVRSMLQKVGMDGMLSELELRLNRAAEAATPKAKDLFLKAIGEMTLEDVQGIYNGPDDAATRYFQQKMSPDLAAEMRPVVEQRLSDVGAVQTYDQVMGEYRSLPFAPDIQADLPGYVVDKGMEGIFHYLAIEEAAIRKDPAQRTTDLLKKVFGGN